jgi:hypothetical protein
MSCLSIVVQVLRVPLGPEAAGKLVEAVLEAFAAAGVMESCFSPSSSSPQSKVRLVEHLLAILALDCNTQGRLTNPLVAPTLSLCLDRILPHMPACPELAVPLFRVFASTLSNSWRFFFDKSIGGGGGNIIPGREQVFCRVMEAFGATFLEPDLHLFRFNLAALDALNSKWKLYSKPVSPHSSRFATESRSQLIIP